MKYALLPVYIAVQPFYFIEKSIFNVDSQWSWFPLAFLRALRISGKICPEIIYSTGPPATAHVAALLLSALKGIPWIAELADPLVYKDFHHTRLALILHSLLERAIFKRASAIVFMADGAMEDAIARAGANGFKARVIYTGAVKPDLPPFSWSPGEFCRFAHFGSLGGSRNTATFLKALEVLFAAEPELAGVVRLDLYGAMDELSRNLMKNFKYPGVITDFGKVQRWDAQLAMQKSDVLLLIHNLDDFGSKTIPVKLYDYFHVNRPVLGLVYRSPGLRNILREYGHFAAEADSVPETAEVIAGIIGKWRKGELTGSGWTHSPFTLDSALEKLVALADEVLANRHMP